MRVKKEGFPVVVQAYESVTSKPDHFIAEQVVYSQLEVDTFTARYAGKLIRQRPLTSAELNRQTGTAKPKRRRSALGVIVLILLILAILIFIGFATGWIQQNLGIDLMVLPKTFLTLVI